MDANLSVAEKRLLLALPKAGPMMALKDVMVQAGFALEAEVLQAVDRPQRLGLVDLIEEPQILWRATSAGIEAQQQGLPEERAWKALQTFDGRMSLSDLEVTTGLPSALVSVAVGILKKRRAIAIERGENTFVVATGKEFPTSTETLLLSGLTSRALPYEKSPELVELQRRGFAESIALVHRFLVLTHAGQSLARNLKPDDIAIEINQVTPELIAKWGTLSPVDRAKHGLRPFDFNVPVTVPSPGKAHPLTHIITEIRDIFVALGFTEIAGDYVEPAFWNMDALFIPQDHPARDMQDTFYLKSPAKGTVPDALFATVRDVHQKGGKTGSAGWGGSFRREESERALLRTHTTVTTIRHLAAHPRPPVRTFGIGRVFRNEAMDATHLPEFHQVEGIVVEEGATLSMLMGVLREFYKRMGFPQVKFRPSFYPYTEPSLDVAVKWGDKWLELGGAGVFRPEVTQPLGVPCNVLAWGLGLERLAMLRLGLKDIRQLYLSDVQWLRETPVR